ncbi:DUF669 domain-containing protein [Ureibacillus sp. FSL K6-0165]|uniref:DUF669 domain-containing protein n=1 Tax=Ureibacillus sp. FSL K6-0165 TaxID=2954606 RepID=UPI0030F892A4
MNQNIERELGWDDTIEKDDGGFILLPEGDYDFTVTKFERARFQGSAKMPPCNQAKLELTVHSQEYGDVKVFHNLFLHTKTEWQLSQFFMAIGQKKKGEPLRMNWGTVPGSKGRLKLKIDEYEKDGKKYQNNKVEKFYPYEEVFGAAPQQQTYQAPPQQTYQQPVQQPQQPFPTTPFPTNSGGFTPGQF